ncbi:MAG: hypothetical protein LC620_03810, partial [Halobacteriales archaeon]|nr:hypothetical protein [Halobacteriales archaeon]
MPNWRTSIVVGKHLVDFAVDGKNSPDTIDVTIRLDDFQPRTFTAEGWLPPRWGVTSDGRFYWWSGKTLWPLDLFGKDLKPWKMGEPIVAAFGVPGGWVLALDATVVGVRDGVGVVFKANLPELCTDARMVLGAEYLRMTCFDGTFWQTPATGPELGPVERWAHLGT